MSAAPVKDKPGYPPVAAYLGREGCIPFVKRVLGKARVLTRKKLLVALDSGHDAVDPMSCWEKLKSSPTLSQVEPQTGRYQRTVQKGLCRGQGCRAPSRKKGCPGLTVRKRQEYEEKTYVIWLSL